MVAKLSSLSTMLAASRVTSAPVSPMAMPISASLTAGASFTPSPVMTTTCPILFKALTISNLCWGRISAKTLVWAISSASFSGSTASSSLPITTLSPGLIMPNSMAIALAVAGLSPVSIFTSMPAWRHFARASYISLRGGSFIPISPAKTMFLSMRSSGSARPAAPILL